MKKDIVIVSSLILAMAIFRIYNAEHHLYNLVPMAALGIFSGATLQNKKWAIAIPLVSMLLSDIGLSLFTNTPGFYGISQTVNYIALALVTLLGAQVNYQKGFSILGYTLAGSMLFFIISNFGTFLQGYYGYSFNGLINCYTMAIPFYKSEFSTTIFLNAFKADLLFSLIAFAIYYLAHLSKLQIKKA